MLDHPRPSERFAASPPLNPHVGCVVFTCGDLSRAFLSGTAHRCASRHGLACRCECDGHTLRIVVEGEPAEIERYVAAMRYVLD